MAKRICLFDVDGTLTIPRGEVKENMIETLKELQKYIDVGIVGGSDHAKIREQLTDKGNLIFDLVLGFVDYTFTENGLKGFKGKQPLPQASIKDFLGEQKLKDLINFCLKYLADIDIPIKRGTFIEYRTGMLNISPIGRNCSQEERCDFEKYDLEHKIREKFIAAIHQKFPDIGLTYSIGGQISFDAFPIGWNKTYCLRFLEEYEEIYFFGDKTFKGGNDYEIYEHIKGVNQSRAFSVKTGPEQTIQILREKFIK